LPAGVSPERRLGWQSEVSFGAVSAREVMEARRHPRYKLEIEILVYPRNSAVLRGNTVDISESGISAMLRDEVRLDEVVRLEFELPLGTVEVHALARQRSAFRYGFQFVGSAASGDRISQTCRQLALLAAPDQPDQFPRAARHPRFGP